MVTGHRTVSTLFLVIFGMALVIIGAMVPPLQWRGVQLSVFMTNLGLYVTVVVSLQWFYEHKSRQLLSKEITEATISNMNIAGSGLANFIQNTKKISYSEMLDSKSPLVFGFHYSPNIIDSHFPALVNRAKTGKETTILMLDANGSAATYLASHDENAMQITANYEKINRKISNLNSEDSTKTPIKLLSHNAILRYSFVGNEDGVWVKLYKNCKGYAEIPGLFVKKNSTLFDFYNSDIIELIREASNVEA